MMLVLDVCLTLFCISLSSILYAKIHRNIGQSSRPQGYILQNQVTHARFLPTKSAHSFTYPTLSLLLSLNALESHTLDLGKGFVFGYGGLWGRLTGLRSGPYLTVQGGNWSIRNKLEYVLTSRGLMGNGVVLDDAWMMTMPSLLGYEGINPLTVYFCYKSGGELWLIVLEIHNTFGESHIHILEVGKNEDTIPPKGFDHQWTFLREFHVSPFNDRSGFYTVSIKKPSHPPTTNLDLIHQGPPILPPRPTIRIHLHTALTTPPPRSQAPYPGSLKLTALLRPTSATPLTTPSLLRALLRAPFVLFLSFPRIAYNAWILHYKKRLDVFVRPEPLPAVPEWGAGADVVASGSNQIGGGIKWLGEGSLERYARQRVENFLRARVAETRISVTLISANPSVGCRTFPAPTIFNENRPRDTDMNPNLTISYLSPRFFTVLLLSPSAMHALLLGSATERIFFPSSRDLFISTFSPPSSLFHTLTFRQRIRIYPIPASLVSSPTLPIPPSHPLDSDCTTCVFITTAVILITLFLERLEAWVFYVGHARPVRGQEPWMQWDRATSVFMNDEISRRQWDTIGSVRREE